MNGTMNGMYLFQTSVGTCGIGWTERGVDCFVLPCGSETATKRELTKRAPGREFVVKPPQHIAQAAKKIAAHLDGKLDELKDIDVDCSSFTTFEQKVYKTLRNVKPGHVVTYGELATKAGHPGASRAVGSAMAKNPVSLIVPCHRVVKSDGSLGQFSAPAGPNLKRRLLGIEGHSRNSNV